MNERSKRGIIFPVIFAIFAIVVIVLAWHIIFPLLGVGIVLTLGLWAVIVVSVVLVSLGVLLLFLLPGIFIGLIALFVLAWAVFALVLFPFLFPLLAPLLIILFVLAYLVGRGRRRS